MGEKDSFAKTTYIGGDYIETINGKKTDYVKELVSNVQGKSNFTAEETFFGNDPKSAPPLGISNIYVKIRLKEGYKGEFGFDWVDVNPDSKEIEKIQDVDFSNVEYFYKEGATKDDLGNIVEKGDGTEAKKAIQERYKFNSSCKHVDIPYVLIKPAQEITLSAEIILCDGEFKDDEIKITGDEYFDFEFIGGLKEEKNAKIKVTAAGKIDLKIKCIKEIPAEKKYEFYHTNATSVILPVGGITMMENKVLKLNFRVIALVSNDNDPNAKAKALFKKFKDTGVKDYLNQNSLNQAGYEVGIENFAEMDNADVDDYFYAFDKEEWVEKKYFGKKEKEKQKLTPEGYGIKKPDGTYEKEKVLIEVIVDETKDLGEVNSIKNEMDSICIKAYEQKLKAKGKTYQDGGFIILSDYESASPKTGAYSRPTPLNHYTLLVFSTNTSTKDTYSHEIGHMLGLPHSFYTEKEKESYKNARESILGDGTPNRKGIKGNIEDVKKSKADYWGWINIDGIKDDIIVKLKEHNTDRSAYVEKQRSEKKEKEAYYINYKKTDFITYKDGSKESKENYLKGYENRINDGKKAIDENIAAINELKNNGVNNYVALNKKVNFKRSDLLLILSQSLIYYQMIINQMHKNYVFFKKGTTKNILDYDNEELYYNAHQILIMRSDIQNYMNIPCEFCKPSPTIKNKK